MYKRLISHSAEVVIRIGRRILTNLRVDPRMTEAIATLEEAQGTLEAKEAAWEVTAEAAVNAEAERGRTYRLLSSSLREFGFTVLSVTGNHHNIDPYLRYFPYGYGEARTLLPVQIMEFTRLLLVKLEEEPDPKIAAGRDLLAPALEAMENAEAACELAVRARTEAFGVVQSEKRNWTLGLARSRALAEFACFYDHAYVRRLYAAAAPSGGNGGPDAPDQNQTPPASSSASADNSGATTTTSQPEAGNGGTTVTANPAGTGNGEVPVPATHMETVKNDPAASSNPREAEGASMAGAVGDQG